MIKILINKIPAFPLSWQQKTPLVNFILFAICLMEIAIVLIFIPISFFGSDDGTMNSIASGAMTGLPSEFLLFTNVTIGFILKSLYKLSLQINWYAWYLISAYTMAYCAIQYVFFNLKTNNLSKISLHIIILALLLPAVLSIQFTKIAALSLTAGFLLIFTYQKQSTIRAIFAILLVLGGALIRNDVFYMYVALSLPLLVYFLLVKMKRKVILSFIALIVGFGFIALDEIVYQNNPDFIEYREYNKLRSAVTTHDNPSFTYDNVKDIIEEVGWTKEDFDVASSFNLDIGFQKFSKENLLFITQETKKIDKILDTKSIIRKIFRVFKSFQYYFHAQFLYLLPIIIILIFLLFSYNKKHIFIPLLFATYIFSIACCLSILLNGNLSKERVIWSFILPLCILSILFLTQSKNNLLNKYYYKHISSLLLIGIASMVIIKYTRATQYNNRPEQYTHDKAVSIFLDEQEHQFYASWCVLSRYKIYELPYTQKNAYHMGWRAGSPFNKEKIKRHTGKDNVGIYSLYDQDVVWYFRNNSFYKYYKYHEKVESFYKSNFPNVIINKETIPLNNQDTIYKYVYFVPSHGLK